MATVAIADRSHTAITEASVPSRCRSAWRRVSLAMRRRSESTDPASWNALLPPVPGAVRESGLCRRPGECVDQVAGLGQHGGRREQDLIVTAEPIGAPGMVLIPAIGQLIQDIGVSDDHELSRLRAGALSKRLTGSPGHSGPPALLFSWLRRGLGSHGLPKASPNLPTGSRGSGAG